MGMALQVACRAESRASQCALVPEYRAPVISGSTPGRRPGIQG
jgi:hypothetical protein